MKFNKFTYQKSGVNISEADKFISFISKNTGKKNRKIKILVDLVQFQVFQKNLKIRKL